MKNPLWCPRAVGYEWSAGQRVFNAHFTPDRLSTCQAIECINEFNIKTDDHPGTFMPLFW